MGGEISYNRSLVLKKYELAYSRLFHRFRQKPYGFCREMRRSAAQNCENLTTTADVLKRLYPQKRPKGAKIAENRAEGEIFSERGGTREQVRAYFMK